MPGASQRSSDYHQSATLDQSAKVSSAGRIMDHNDFALLPGGLSDGVKTNARRPIDRSNMHGGTLQHVFDGIQLFGDNPLTGHQGTPRNFSCNHQRCAWREVERRKLPDTRGGYLVGTNYRALRNGLRSKVYVAIHRDSNLRPHHQTAPVVVDQLPSPNHGHLWA